MSCDIRMGLPASFKFASFLFMIASSKDADMQKIFAFKKSLRILLVKRSIY